jgi:hypothetical protein
MVTYSRPDPRDRRVVVIAIVCVALLAVGFAVYWWTRSSSTPPKPAAAPAVTPSAPAQSQSVLPATSPPVVPPQPKRIPHQRVAPAAPTAFTLTGRKFTIKAQVCSMAPVFPLDPPGDQHHTVCWVNGGFGVAPSSDGATSYVLGHAWAEDSQEVLNKVSAPATREVLHDKPRTVDGVPVYPVHRLNGYRLVLHTPAGRLTYRVSKAYGVGKLDLGQVKSAMNQHARNRVVLITCAERNGVDYDYNIVLYAKLYSSVRAAPSRA